MMVMALDRAMENQGDNTRGFWFKIEDVRYIAAKRLNSRICRSAPINLNFITESLNLQKRFHSANGCHNPEQDRIGSQGQE